MKINEGDIVTLNPLSHVKWKVVDVTVDVTGSIPIIGIIAVSELNIPNIGIQYIDRSSVVKVISQ
jgi:hypothetical protein